MLKKILLGLAALIIALVIFIATRPSDFRVERSTSIEAKPVFVFSQVNDLHKWEAWSPWAKLDPNSKSTFAGPPTGTGASMSWAGNNEVGEGTMTITESRENNLIKFRLDFRKPFEGTSDTEFAFRPDYEKTVVTWTMTGKNNFIGKAMGLFMDCDKICGDQFEKGLANLKAVSEAEAKK